MTMHERMLAVIEGRKPDAVPWSADLTYWQHGQKARGTLPEQYDGADGLLQLHRDLGVGVYLFTPSLINVERDPELFWSETEQDGDVHRHTIHTPEGSVSGMGKHLPQSASHAVLEWPVKTVDDLRVVRCWYEGGHVTENYAAVLECFEEWGDSGLGMPLIPRTPLAALACEWSGVTNLAFIAADDPDEFERTLEVMRRSEDELYRLYAEAPVPAVEIGENLSAETMTGLWRRYSRDYYHERTAMLHASGKKVGCHIDGTLGQLLGDIVEAGIDFPESVVPAPVGDLTLSEIREQVGPDAIVWGCVPGAMFAPPYERETVLEFVREAFQVLGSTGPLVLASADQVPPNGDIELVRIIGEEVERLGPPG